MTVSYIYFLINILVAHISTYNKSNRFNDIPNQIRCILIFNGPRYNVTARNKGITVNSHYEFYIKHNGHLTYNKPSFSSISSPPKTFFKFQTQNAPKSFSSHKFTPISSIRSRVAISLIHHV